MEFRWGLRQSCQALMAFRGKLRIAEFYHPAEGLAAGRRLCRRQGRTTCAKAGPGKKKAELVSRLEEHAKREKAEATATENTEAETTPTAAARKMKTKSKTKREPLDDAEDALAANLSSSFSSLVATPGTAGLVPATPAAAAAEKRRAGERGNVEHVAQGGDDLATALGPALPGKRRGREGPPPPPPDAAAGSPSVTPAPKQKRSK